jgi:hypothetical protein
MDLWQRFLTAGHVLMSEKRLLVQHLKHYSLKELLTTDFWRASALIKILLRKKIANRGQKHKYYASVPWYFALGVTLSWLTVLLNRGRLALAAVPGVGSPGLCRYSAAQSAVSGPPVSAARPWFFIKSCLFLLPDMVVSGLGILHALLTFAQGKHY